MVAGGKLVHATCVAAAGRGILISGPSGSGKSDLALRFITSGDIERLCGAPPRLVGDDQIVLENVSGRVIARPPTQLAGKLEVRGLGIVDFAHVAEADVALLVKLVASNEVPRMSDNDICTDLLGVSLPLVRLNALEPSAHIKMALALVGAC